MKAIDRLKRDHQLLRSKLDVLEAALAMRPQTWFVLREICYTLSRQLQDHIRREERLVAACRNALSQEALAHMQVEHKDEPELLRSVNRLFIEQGGSALPQVDDALRQMISRLRAHMAEEETELFPVIERILCDRKEDDEEAALAGDRLHEEMMVNYVLHAYPRTQAVFERLFINIAYEGYDCLDEVAWRHGMEGKELLSKLEEVIGSKGSSVEDLDLEPSQGA